jgi:hypothetical protein
MRAHGVSARYVWGPDENDQPGHGCRCQPCKDARSADGRARRQRVEPAYVAANPARAHVAWLGDQGVGMKQIVKVSGVSHGCLWKLVYGLPPRGVSKRIRKSTADKILAVTPADGADGSRVPAGPTIANIDRIVAAGIPKARIAERVGQTGPGLQHGSILVTRKMARAVQAMVDELDAGTLVTVRRSRHGDVTLAPAGRPPVDPLAAREEHYELVSDLADAIEARVARPWRHQAACRSTPTWLFFPGRGDAETGERAKTVCSWCPVSAECLAENLHQRDGIYGGMSPMERRHLARQMEVAS